MLKTKSILEKKNQADGIRICVMRRIHPEYKFDVWIPRLAPSERLLKKYVIDKKITWEKFSEEFDKSVIKQNKSLISMLTYISKKKTITLLCAEKSVSRCHRALILKACKKTTV